MHVFSDSEREEILALLQLALREDHAGEDITSRAVFPACQQMKAVLMPRQPMVFAGAQVLPLLLEVCGGIRLELLVEDGQWLEAGQAIGFISGATRDILALERSVLNVLQRLSGVASLTRRYVQAVSGTHATILDTRKTIPGWRVLDKYAVRCGGGVNHRMHLADAVMLKDNHIAAAGSVEAALNAVIAYGGQRQIPIIVECDTPQQVAQVLACGQMKAVSRILLDNMNCDTLAHMVALVAGRIPLEASGGVNLHSVEAIAKTGVDFISVGAITHSAVAVDIGLDELQPPACAQ